MTLNSSGPISLAGTTAGQSIEIENGGTGTTQISLNDAAVRSLAGVPSGAITMPTNFYGKSNRVSVSYTFTTNTQNASLNLSALGGYSAGKTDFTVTVDSGIYLWAGSTGNYGLNLTGSTTGDTVTLVNNGYIMGAGGTGGRTKYCYYNPDGTAGTAGGPALNVGIGAASITINNTNASAYIGGGGGGGGGGGAGPAYNTSLIGSGGGGAGGGLGGAGGGCSNFAAGGGIGASGSTGACGSYGNGWCGCNGTFCGGYGGGGGGGGRIFPGSGGYGGFGYGGNTGGGGGGAGGGGGTAAGVDGGAGGSAGSAGAAGGSNYARGAGGGGGGWGASGGYATYGNSPASGGKAVNLNGKTVTWVSGNTTRVYGAVS